MWNFWDLGNFGALNVNIQNEVTNSASIHAGPYVSTNDINMIDPTKLLRTWRMKRERRSKQQRNKYSTWARRRRTELGNSRVLLLSLYSEFITHAVTLTAHSGSLATSTRPTECLFRVAIVRIWYSRLLRRNIHTIFSQVHTRPKNFNYLLQFLHTKCT